MPEVLAPDAIVPDIHDAVAVEISGVAAVSLPEVLAPDPIIADVDDAITVDVTDEDCPGGCAARSRRDRRRTGGWHEDFPHPAAVRASCQEIEARVQLQLDYLGVRQTRSEPDPVVTQIGRSIDPCISSNIQHIRGHTGVERER